MVSTSEVSDRRFESLVNELSTRANLTRERLALLIQEKKAKVGGGYLTDQGALFLIASELGIGLAYDQVESIALSKLTPGQNSVNVISRILSIGSPKTFTRKSDSRSGVLSRLIIYDSSATASVSMWDQAATNFLDNLNVKPGDLIKISNAYTRQGIDGSVILNLGEKGSLEKIPEEKRSDMSTKILTLVEKKISSFATIPENGKMLVLSGKVEGVVRRANFTRSDGSSSDYYGFTIVDEKDIVSKLRVVIWGNSNPTFLSLRDSEIVTLLNVRTRLSSFQNAVAVEIHGDDSTCVLERWDATIIWMKEFVLHFRSSTAQPTAIPHQKSTPGSASIIPFVARIISLRESDEEGKAFLLLTDSQKRSISLNVSGDGLNDIDHVKSNDVVVCKPETIDYLTFKASVTREKSIQKVGSKRQDIPTESSLFCNLEDLQQDGRIVSLEVMCITNSLSREIQTKDGLVRRAEITVADHTSEIKVYGWRHLVKLLENLSAGDRLILSAVEVQSHEGKRFIVLKNYSTVKKGPI